MTITVRPSVVPCADHRHTAAAGRRFTNTKRLRRRQHWLRPSPWPWWRLGAFFSFYACLSSSLLLCYCCCSRSFTILKHSRKCKKYGTHRNKPVSFCLHNQMYHGIKINSSKDLSRCSKIFEIFEIHKTQKFFFFHFLQGNFTMLAEF